jgi:DNA-binding winged helix-turn-helix (wHTH) protein
VPATTFGKFRLDSGTRQLFRDGGEVPLSPKALDLLQFLIDNRTRAVSKAELHDRVWPGTFVTEATVASVVAELRRALDDDPKTPKFVRTVHRFGYAFCGTLNEDGGAAPPARGGSASAAQTCWLVWNARELPLNDGENVIGRDADAAVRLDAPSVSRRHARIVVSNARVTVEDLDSKNGTRLGDRLVTTVATLSDLDELTIGSVRMVVRILRGGEETQTRSV